LHQPLSCLDSRVQPAFHEAEEAEAGVFTGEVQVAETVFQYLGLRQEFSGQREAVAAFCPWVPDPIDELGLDVIDREAGQRLLKLLFDELFAASQRSRMQRVGDCFSCKRNQPPLLVLGPSCFLPRWRMSMRNGRIEPLMDNRPATS
jgi:hypothetical protein